MKSLYTLVLSIIFICFVPNLIFGQIIMTNGSTTNTCTGTFVDPGGLAANYGNNENVVHTICPDVPGDCLWFEFTSFNTQKDVAAFGGGTTEDVLNVYDGASTAATLITSLSGDYGAVDFPSGSSNGCITFEFISTANDNFPGWEALISCRPCPRPQQSADQDCIGSIPICEESYFMPYSYSNTGFEPGEVNMANSCLVSEEQNSVWFMLNIHQDGNLRFMLHPLEDEDFNWAIYDITNHYCYETFPVTNGAPVLSCNHSNSLAGFPATLQNDGRTGANSNGPYNGTGNSAGDNDSPFNGDIPVTDGQILVLVVTNEGTPNSGFYLDFSDSDDVIVDNRPPAVREVTLPIDCGDFQFWMYMTEDLDCNSVDVSDFLFEGPGGPYTITDVWGLACETNPIPEHHEKYFRFTVFPTITNSGTYTFSIVDEVTDNCGNSTSSYEYSFFVDQTRAAAGNDVTFCEGDSPTVTLGGGPTNPDGGTILWTSDPPAATGFLTGATTDANPGLNTAGMTAGTYTYYANIDNSSCLAQDTIVITVNDCSCVLTVDATGTNPLCNGASDGSITSTTTGGTAPYTYDWDNAPDVQNPTGLLAGLYIVTVTSTDACIGTTAVFLSEPGALSISAVDPTDVTCVGDCDGDILATPAGGTWPYTYNWENSSNPGVSISNFQNPSGLCAGTYCVTITDGNNCTVVDCGTIGTSGPMINSTSSTDENCSNGDGTATANITNGITPLQYSWEDAANTGIIVSSTNPASNLPAGTYNLTVSNNDGSCPETTTIVVGNSCGCTLTASAIGNAALCAGASDGTATATANTGTAPYTFIWNDTNSQTTATATGLVAGNYIVTITDNNSCTATASTSVSEPSPLATNVTVGGISCFGANDGMATENVTGGTPPYTYAWSNGEITNPATGLGPGVNSCTVTDSNGCTATGMFTITEPAQIIISTTSNTPSNCLSCDGQAVVGVVGGVGPYTYNWANGETVAAPINLCAGNNALTVTDADGCTATHSISTSSNATLSLDNIAVDNNVSCNGASDGQATATISGGTAPYGYLWENNQTTTTVTGLSGGNYGFTVVDANGCVDAGVVSITEPSAISVSSNSTDESCTGNDGTASLTVSGGLSPYNFQWENNANLGVSISTTNSATNLSPGTYNYTVTDNAGNCPETGSVIILNACVCTLTASATGSSVLCAGDIDGTATATPNAGTAPYSFIWSDTNSQTTSTATGLIAGNYTVTITDNNSCTATALTTISEPSPLTTNVTVAGISCFGANDGMATENVTGGTPPYTYAWSNGEITNPATGLGPGVNSCTVTDSNGCTATGMFTITEPNPVVISTTSNIPSNCLSCDGQATVSVVGGVAPYTYNWSNGATTANPTNLCAGNNTVTVTDSDGCTASHSISTGSNATLSLDNITVDNNVSCNGASDGQATASISGGTAPYGYLWENGQTTITVTGLSGGNYGLTVVDVNGCIDAGIVSITEQTAISVLSNSTDESCSDSDGTASLTVSGGLSPYNYQWENSANSGVSISTTNPATNLSAGTYNYTVTDNNGNCPETGSVIVGNTCVCTLTASATGSSVLCAGDSDGTTTAIPNTGTAPYTYIWNDTNNQTTAIATGLVAGNYTVTITDINSCMATASTTVTEPSLLTTNITVTGVSCFGASDGTATENVSGGTPPYTFIWSDGQTSNPATGLPSGANSCTVTDANGCITTGVFTITEPLQLIISTNSNTPSNCLSCDGIADVGVSGGTAPYSYNWDNGANISNPTNLCAGNNVLTVTDANGCIATHMVSISSNSTLSIDNINVDNNVSCNGTSDGQATASIIGGTAPFGYLWENGQTTATATGLSGGNYGITVVDVNGCIDAGVVTISEQAALSISSNATDETCATNDGTASVTVSGGTGTYNYLWDDALMQTTGSINGLNTGTYNVTVTDTDGCSITSAVVVGDACICGITLTTSNNDISCFGANDGTATANIVGGTNPISILWSDPLGQSTATATNLSAGIYTITVTDAIGCVETASVTINEPSTLGLSVLGTDVSCFGQADGSATATISGGTLPYSIEWDNSEVNNPAIFLTSGIHTVTVTDGNNCQITSSVNIGSPALLLPTGLSTLPASCFGGSDGQATANATGGTAPYTFVWSNGVSGSTITGLMAGVYDVDIIDANGCTLSPAASLTVGQPLSPISSTMSSNSPSCFGGNDGSATVVTSGGTPSYTYLWTNGSTDASAFNLTAGNYAVTITDSNGCVDVNNISLTAPSSAINVNTTGIDITCFGASDGSVSLTVSGGTAPYDFIWDDGSTNANITGLSAGNYAATLTDANGCDILTNYTVIEPWPIVNAITSSPTSCFGGIDGSATVTTSGGIAPYLYQWDNGELTSTANLLSGGNHQVTVFDSNGCFVVESVVISSPTVLVPNSFTLNSVSCFGGSDGSAEVLATGGTPPYSYTWNTVPAQSGSLATGLTAGVYEVVISDANSCTTNPISITITGPTAPISIDVIPSNVSCFGGEDGGVAVLATGGIPSYTYEWSVAGETGQTLLNVAAGDYFVTVTDANGCQMTSSTTLTEPTEIISYATTTDNTCFGDESGMIQVDSSRGSQGPYVYSLDGANFQTDTVFNNLPAGSYALFTQDVLGCEVMQILDVLEPYQLEVDAGPDVTIVLGDSLDLYAPANALDLTYTWSPPTYLSCIDCDDPNVFPLETTTYEVMVMDTLGCSATDEITVFVDEIRDVFIPNAFSPNDDGINDKFVVNTGISVTNIQSFLIYDRWGELIFNAENIPPNEQAFGWDGNFKGKRLNPGVYVYYVKLEFIDGVIDEFKGDVTIVK